MDVHHKYQYIQCSRRPEEGIRCKGTGVTDPCEPCGFPRIEPGLSERGVRDLNHWDNSPASHIHILYHLLWFLWIFFGDYHDSEWVILALQAKDLLKAFREVCSGKRAPYLSASPFLIGVGKQSKCKRSHLGAVYYSSSNTLEYGRFLPVVYLIFFCVPSSGPWLLDSTFTAV